MSLPDHDELVARVQDRLGGPLPGHEAHAEMAPYAHRTDASVISVEGKDAREAAVLVLLYPHETSSALVLTARQPSLRDHSGQVSFPGGRREPGESMTEAALREGYEEVGLDPSAADVLGGLTPLYIPPSRFSVFPIVAATDHRPPFIPQEEEVAALIEVPLPRLLTPDVRQSAPRVLGGGRFEVPYWALAGYEVWGATAMMLAEFVRVLRAAAEG